MRVPDTTRHVDGTLADMTVVAVTARAFPRIYDHTMRVAAEEREASDHWMDGGIAAQGPFVFPDLSMQVFGTTQAHSHCVRPPTVDIAIDECHRDCVREYTVPAVGGYTEDEGKLRETGHHRLCELRRSQWLRKRGQLAYCPIQPKPVLGARAPRGPEPKAKAKVQAPPAPRQRVQDDLVDVYDFYIQVAAPASQTGASSGTGHRPILPQVMSVQGS